MGATERRSSGNVMFLSQRDGSFWQRVDESTPNAKPRVLTKGDNAGKTIYEKEYFDVYGFIKDIQLKETDFGNRWEIAIQDDENYKVVISYPDDSYDWFTIAETLPSLDLTKKVKFQPYDFKGRKGISIKQLVGSEWVKIYSFYKKFEDGKFVGYLHGFPDYTDVNRNDKDEKEDYWRTVKRYLKKATLHWIEKKFTPMMMDIESASINAQLGFTDEPKSIKERIEEKPKAPKQTFNDDMDQLPF